MKTPGKPAVPLSVAVKYIIKERDKYKEKLEQLAPYTKSLEKRLADAAEPYEHKIKSLEGDIKQLRKENDAFRKGYKETTWYANMVKEIQRLRQENKDLWDAVNKYHLTVRNDKC